MMCNDFYTQKKKTSNGALEAEQCNVGRAHANLRGLRLEGVNVSGRREKTGTERDKGCECVRGRTTTCKRQKPDIEPMDQGCKRFFKLCDGLR